MALATEYDWKRYPEVEAALARWVSDGLAGNAFAADLAGRMRAETGTRFIDWLDHVVIRDTEAGSADLEGWGFTRDWATNDTRGGLVYRHDGGLYPRVVTRPKGEVAVIELAIKVESVADFSRAHDLGLRIDGYALGPYRVGRVAGRGRSTPGTASCHDRAGWRRTRLATRWRRAICGSRAGAAATRVSDFRSWKRCWRR